MLVVTSMRVGPRPSVAVNAAAARWGNAGRLTFKEYVAW